MSTTASDNGVESTINGHHTDSSVAKIEPEDFAVQSSSYASRVTVRSGVAKRAKEKGLIMEQDIDGLEYSSEEETTRINDDLDDLFVMSTKKSKAVS